MQEEPREEPGSLEQFVEWQHRMTGSYRRAGAAGGWTMSRALWTAQVLLALLFLWAGGIKLILPLEQLVGPFPLPGAFLRFLGAAEVLGAIGLILPGVLRIRPGLTPLAAAGLVIIMAGATTITLADGTYALALLPMVAGLLAAFVAYGRWRLAPLADRTRAAAQPEISGTEA